MKHGILLSFQAPAEFGVTPQQAYAEALEQAALAEELGFDSAWVTEHHFAEDGYLPSPLIACTAIAARTSRIRIGQAITILPLANPVRFAEDVATMDVLSGGRVDIGVGMGYRREEYDGVGVDWGTRARRFEESLEVLDRAWTGEQLDHHGDVIEIKGAAVRPRPVQPGGPPVWLGAKSRRGMLRAARRGAPFLLPMTPTLGDVADQADDYRRALKDVGRDPATVPLALMREVWLGESDEAAIAQTAAGVHYAYTTVYRPEKIPFRDGDRMVTSSDDAYLASPAFRHDRMLHGSADRVRARLEEYQQRVGMSHLICRFAIPGVPHDLVTEAMRRFADEVIARDNERHPSQPSIHPQGTTSDHNDHRPRNATRRVGESRRHF